LQPFVEVQEHQYQGEAYLEHQHQEEAYLVLLKEVLQLMDFKKWL